MNPPWQRARHGVALLIGCSALLCGQAAHAFCRSTTCTEDCSTNEQMCKTEGFQLSWRSSCVGFSIQSDGTRNLPMKGVRDAIVKSFIAWTDVPCEEGGNATIAFSQLTDVGCHIAEFNEDGRNANIIMFQDDRWEYTGLSNNIAKTTVTFDVDSGDLWDADIELNYAFNELTLGEDRVVYDLQSVLTHEIGHFLGLDHSPLPTATMYAGYSEGSIDLRTIELDDSAGVCAIYPPNQKRNCDPEPRNGFTEQCLSPQEKYADGAGCAMEPEGDAGRGVWAMMIAALLASCSGFMRRCRRT